MLRGILRSKFFKTGENSLDFLTNKSIYSNKSLLYYQTNFTNDYFKSIFNETRTLKKKINTFNFYLTQASSYSAETSSSFTKAGSLELARQFVNSLTIEERNTIKQQILEAEIKAALNNANPNITVLKPTWSQLSVVSLQCGLPFIGFGFIDNFLMILFGDIIESSIGMIVPISTMAAAGLGNAISDVVGIGVAHHIEAFALKFVKQPELTTEQWELPLVSWVMAISKSICIFIGCVIGMSPLLFMNNNKKDTDSEKAENENKK